MSHPSWVCGLKLRCALIMPLLVSHTLRGCVDWNKKWDMNTETQRRHTLRGCVDWNTLSRLTLVCVLCHTLRGCVDWNSVFKGVLWCSDKSHPSWVCGLKRLGLYEGAHDKSHTLRGCVDWNILISDMNVCCITSHPSWVCGLKPCTAMAPSISS